MICVSGMLGRLLCTQIYTSHLRLTCLTHTCTTLKQDLSSNSSCYKALPTLAFQCFRVFNQFMLLIRLSFWVCHDPCTLNCNCVVIGYRERIQQKREEYHTKMGELGGKFFYFQFNIISIPLIPLFFLFHCNQKRVMRRNPPSCLVDFI